MNVGAAVGEGRWDVGAGVAVLVATLSARRVAVGGATNGEAVAETVMLGVVVGCVVAGFSRFGRKNPLGRVGMAGGVGVGVGMVTYATSPSEAATSKP